MLFGVEKIVSGKKYEKNYQDLASYCNIINYENVRYVKNNMGFQTKVTYSEEYCFSIQKYRVFNFLSRLNWVQ